MGRFSTTVHIKNNVDRMRFVNTFSDVMKKRGFAPCTEDEAAVSYLMVFNEGWVTLANDEYKDNPKKSSDDIREMSAALKTSAFSVEVVDSDFAIMTLCAPNGTEDRLVVGDGSGYDVPEMAGDRKLWEPLLADGKTWEEFSEAAAAREVFVEDALGKVAAVLRIDPYYMDADHDEVSAKADGNSNITAFYFKKAAVKEKTMSLNAAFKKVFGEALEPLGFKLIKSKFPYFVRVVPGGEIIHVITLTNEPSSAKGRKFFKIFGGIATVYRNHIDLSTNPNNENINWLRSNAVISAETNIKYDFAYKGGIYEFSFEADNEREMLYELEHSLDVTRKVMLPVISKAVDIDSSINFFFQVGMSLSFDERGEGLLFLKTENYSDIIKKEVKRFDDEYKQKVEQGEDGYTFEEYERQLQTTDAVLQREISPIENVLNDPELSDEYFAELERRKAANTELLRSYGLDL